MIKKNNNKAGTFQRALPKYAAKQTRPVQQLVQEVDEWMGEGEESKRAKGCLGVGA